MHKQKANLLSKFRRLFTNQPWLKLVSLMLAVLTWLFVKGEMGRLP